MKDGKTLKFDRKDHFEKEMKPLPCGGTKYSNEDSAMETQKNAQGLADYAKKNKNKR